MSAPAYEPLTGAAEGAVTTTTLDVVIPVYNEEADLEASVLRVLEHLGRLPWSHRVTIADNASTDGTAVWPVGWPTPTRGSGWCTSPRRGAAGR